MKLRLERQSSGRTCTIGELFLNDEKFCNSLEDPIREVSGMPVNSWKVANDTAIPQGSYQVVLSTSGRAQKGHLWTPDEEFFRLPEILNVPGFTAIRIHAGNVAGDTEGCVLVGEWKGGESLSASRKALERLMDVLMVANMSKSHIEIEIVNQPKEET